MALLETEQLVITLLVIFLGKSRWVEAQMKDGDCVAPWSCSFPES